MSSAHRRALEPVAVVLVALWALWQAFGTLGAANLNADEPTYAAAGWAYLHGDLTPNPEHPPVAKLLFGLAQLLGGPGVDSTRMAAGVCTLAGGALLYAWLRAEVGWVGALTAAGAWTLLPHGVSSGVRIDRFGLLDPVMALFAIAAFAAAWRWYRTGSWAWLTLSAAGLGLAIGAKLPVAAMAPALALPLVARTRTERRQPHPRTDRASRRTIRPARVRVGRARIGRVVGGLAARSAVYLLVVAGVGAALLAPFGGLDAIERMLRFQAEHSAAGHLVEVAGVATTHPPWWAGLRFAVDGMGVVAAAVLAAGALAAFLRPPRLLATTLATAVLLEWVFQFGLSSVALPHYYYAWVWPLCALFGIGVAALIRIRFGRPAIEPIGLRKSCVGRAAARGAAAALLAAALGAAAWTSVAVAAERPRDMALALPILDRLGAPAGPVLVAGLAEWEYLPYLDGRQTLDPHAAGIVAVAVKASLRFPVDPAVCAILHDPERHFTPHPLDDITLFVEGPPETAEAPDPRVEGFCASG